MRETERQREKERDRDRHTIKTRFSKNLKQ